MENVHHTEPQLSCDTGKKNFMPPCFYTVCRHTEKGQRGEGTNLCAYLGTERTTHNGPFVRHFISIEINPALKICIAKIQLAHLIENIFLDQSTI